MNIKIRFGLFDFHIANLDIELEPKSRELSAAIVDAPIKWFSRKWTDRLFK